MKKKITITIVIILVLLLIAGAAVWYFVFHNSDCIGRDAATEAALSDAGFTRQQVRAIDCGYENDDGFRYYDVTFIYDTTEYEYAVDAVTGEILNVKTESAFD